MSVISIQECRILETWRKEVENLNEQDKNPSCLAQKPKIIAWFNIKLVIWSWTVSTVTSVLNCGIKIYIIHFNLPKVKTEVKEYDCKFISVL